MGKIKKSDSINSNGFVTYRSTKVESFKNKGIHSIGRKLNPKLQNLKRTLNSIIGKPRLWMSNIEIKKSGRESSLWFLEVLIEGAIANWWTHKIFGLEFEVGMIIAHGFLIKQGLDLYTRIKKDGQPTKLLAKTKF